MGNKTVVQEPSVPIGAPVSESTAAPPPASVSQRLQALKDRLDGLRARHQKQRALRAALEPLPGILEDTPYGRVHRYHHAHTADACHGHVPLSQCLTVLPQTLVELALDPALQQVDVSRLLFLDTETTGLSGGAGTLPFLIGAAWFENGALQVEQLLLLKPGEEEPMLQHLRERMAHASAIVTYNGKSFDWPLLRNRFVLNRVPMPQTLPHLDVLHCARRVFKYRKGPLRLTHLERSELGFTRVGDIDGALIPPTYFRFLRGGSSSALTPILTHNRHDLAALVALLAVLAQRLVSVEANAHGVDCLALAQLSERAGVKDRALQFAQAAQGVDAQVLCAKLLRQGGNVQGALEALHRALEHPHAAGHAHVHLALAKMYEHQVRDVSRALQHAAHTAHAEGRAAHEKRLTRLQGRACRP